MASGDRPRPTAPTCAQSGCETTRREITRAAYSGRVVPLLNREGLELDREWHRDLLQGDASTASIAGAFSVNIGAALDPCTSVPLVHPHVPVSISPRPGQSCVLTCTSTASVDPTPMISHTPRHTRLLWPHNLYAASATANASTPS